MGVEWSQAVHPTASWLTFIQGTHSLSIRPVALLVLSKAGVPWACIPWEAAFASVPVQMAGESS